MDTQILVVVQCVQYRVRNVANAHLQRGTILDQILRDQLADFGLDIRHRVPTVLGQRDIHIDCVIEMRLVDDTVTERARHLLVHLGDDDFRIFQRRTHTVHTSAERAVAVVVRWRHRHDCHIRLDELAPEQQRNFVQEDRDRITAAIGHGCPHVAAHEQ